MTELYTYNFVVEHRPGKLHTNCDALSRRPCYDTECKHCERAEAKFEASVETLEKGVVNTSPCITDRTVDSGESETMCCGEIGTCCNAIVHRETNSLIRSNMVRENGVKSDRECTCNCIYKTRCAGPDRKCGSAFVNGETPYSSNRTRHRSLEKIGEVKSDYRSRKCCRTIVCGETPYSPSCTRDRAVVPSSCRIDTRNHSTEIAWVAQQPNPVTVVQTRTDNSSGRETTMLFTILTILVVVCSIQEERVICVAALIACWWFVYSMDNDATTREITNFQLLIDQATQIRVRSGQEYPITYRQFCYQLRPVTQTVHK